MGPISAIGQNLVFAQQRYDAVATRVARSGAVTPVDAVDAIQSRSSFQAQIAVVRTADRMTGRLLDLKV